MDDREKHCGQRGDRNGRTGSDLSDHHDALRHACEQRQRDAHRIGQLKIGQGVEGDQGDGSLDPETDAHQGGGTDHAVHQIEERPLFGRCRLSAAERGELLDIYLARCRWTRIYFLWRPNLGDEADNHLVELAVAGSAQAIVTRNRRDFRGAELKFENLAVLTPAECLRRQTWQP